MTDPLVAGYADALFSVASAEGDPAVVEDELFRFAQLFRADDDLQSSLGDPSVPDGGSRGAVVHRSLVVGVDDSPSPANSATAGTGSGSANISGSSGRNPRSRPPVVHHDASRAMPFTSWK